MPNGLFTIQYAGLVNTNILIPFGIYDFPRMLHIC